MPSIYDELGAMAADPSTDWDTLHWIAENYPQHRAAIAGNPAAYTELLTALGSLGDPEIDAALARRAYGRAARRAPSAATPASSSTSAPRSAAPRAATPEAVAPQAPTTTPPSGAFYSGPRSQPSSPNRPVRSAPTAQNQDHTWSSTSAVETEPEGSPRGRSRPRKLLLTVLLPVLVLIAAVALAVNLLGGSGDSADQSMAEAPANGAEAGDDAGAGADAESAEQPTQQGTESAESNSGGSEGEAEASEAPATADELRASLEALPGASSCDSPAEDLEVFAEFAAAAQEGEAVDAADGTLAQETLIGLQESCGNTHAAAIYVGLLDSGTETAAPLRPSIEAMGTSWIQVSFPAQGQQLTSFASPDGNVLCELSTSLRCTVLQHSFAAPEGCTSGVTYAIEVAGAAEPDCDNPVSPAAQPPLGYGQTASNAFFACSSFQSQMSCWNQLTGEGINLWADRNSTY